MEYLTKLFGSPARVKLLRLFLFNPERVYDRDGTVATTRVSPLTASKELTALARAGVLKRKIFYKTVAPSGAKAPKKRKAMGWSLDSKYPHVIPLTRFLRDTLSITDADIRSRLRGAGAVHLLVLSGFLIGQKESALDMLVVGNKLDEEFIQTAVRAFEAECGQEIRYAVLTTEDYQYRRRVRDKLVRDVMDYPHTVLVDRVSV
ncbi:MAG: hypothetical protein KBD24_01595 [Candidatus Pacebacteria bacterium]|nr:hypothetical protein [Candidatus Paceibacterota bacterium]